MIGKPTRLGLVGRRKFIISRLKVCAKRGMYSGAEIFGQIFLPSATFFKRFSFDFYAFCLSVCGHCSCAFRTNNPSSRKHTSPLFVYNQIKSPTDYGEKRGKVRVGKILAITSTNPPGRLGCFFLRPTTLAFPHNCGWRGKINNLF